MVTVVNLPPDPSFGSGRAGEAIGRFVSGLVESRRKKRLDEERREILLRAFDNAGGDPEAFTKGILEAPGIKAPAIESLTKTFIELGELRRQSKQDDALAEALGRTSGTGEETPASGEVGKPVKEASPLRLDKETIKALGSKKALEVLKFLADNRKAASTAKLNDAKIQRAIDQTKSDVNKLENQKERTKISQAQLKLSQVDKGRKDRLLLLAEQEHALDQKIEKRKQALDELNAKKAEITTARAKRKLEIDEAELLIKQAKEDRALEEFNRTPEERQKRISGEAEAKKTGALNAQIKKMNEVMNSADTGGGGGVVGQHSAPPVDASDVFAGPSQQASPHAQTITRMMITAANLAKAGFTKESNNLIAQARFFANNSPQIARDKALDKLLSDKALSEMGLPWGSTWRDALGEIPRSPEEIVKAAATAKAEGTALIRAREDLGFISEAQSSIKGLLLQVEGDPARGIIGDPGLVGIIGSLRRTGKRAFGIIKDLGLTSLIEGAKELAFSNTDLTAKEQEGLFSSSTLSVLQLIEHSVGLTFARLRTRSGRVPVEVIKISIRDMQLAGGLPSEMVVDRLHFMSNLLSSRGRNIEERHGLAPKKEIPKFNLKGGRLNRY